MSFAKLRPQQNHCSKEDVDDIPFIDLDTDGDCITVDDSDARSAEIEYMNSCYTVYYDPDHRRQFNCEALRQIHATNHGICANKINFEALPVEDLRYWSPFHDRKAEKEYEEQGYSNLLQPWLPLDTSSKWPRGNQGSHAAYICAVEALSGLYILTDVVVSTALKKLSKTGRKPDWLRSDVIEILAPVYGRRSSDTEGVLEPEIPLSWKDGILVGCSDFRRKRTIVPSYVTTRATVEKLDYRHTRRAFGMTRLVLKRRIVLELDDPEMHLGYKIAPDAVALWFCQSAMQLRIIVEELRQSLDPDLLKIAGTAERHKQAASDIGQRIELGRVCRAGRIGH